MDGTSMWLPRFACPECRGNIRDAGGRTFGCVSCGACFEESGGVYGFLSKRRAAVAEPFQRQYRLVREREGYRRPSPEFYRTLPHIDDGDRHAVEWRIRRESLAHLQRHAIPAPPARVLDLGAGNGWLSHQLARDGHCVVAVDRLNDEHDGLGACRHYEVPFAAVQADFDALPLEAAQFDLVIFSGSLHYAADPAATLAHAKQMLVPGGVMAVMDSPMFWSDADGRAMLADETYRMEMAHGIRGFISPGIGFVTFDRLEAMTGSLGLRGRFIPTHGPISWRLRRPIARLRLGRAPAAFGVWVAR